MIHLRLSDSDRERLGCPGWLDIDPYSVTAREASVLQRGFDVEGEKVSYAHPGAWRHALGGGDDGKAPSWAAMTVLVWLALRRAGITVPLAGLDFNLDGLAYKTDELEPEPEPEPGLDASPGKGDEPETSPSSSVESTTSTP